MSMKLYLFSGFSSILSESSVSLEIVVLFILAALRMIFSASSLRPLDMSQRTDSDMNLKQQNRIVETSLTTGSSSSQDDMEFQIKIVSN